MMVMGIDGVGEMLRHGMGHSIGCRVVVSVFGQLHDSVLQGRAVCEVAAEAVAELFKGEGGFVEHESLDGDKGVSGVDQSNGFDDDRVEFSSPYGPVSTCFDTVSKER